MSSIINFVEKGYIGCKVSHPDMGNGVIVGIYPTNIISVRFDSYTTSIQFSRYGNQFDYTSTEGALCMGHDVAQKLIRQ